MHISTECGDTLDIDVQEMLVENENGEPMKRNVAFAISRNTKDIVDVASSPWILWHQLDTVYLAMIAYSPKGYACALNPDGTISEETNWVFDQELRDYRKIN